jgi:hypothetical protein
MVNWLESEGVYNILTYIIIARKELHSLTLINLHIVVNALPANFIKGKIYFFAFANQPMKVLPRLDMICGASLVYKMGVLTLQVQPSSPYSNVNINKLTVAHAHLVKQQHHRKIQSNRHRNHNNSDPDTLYMSCCHIEHRLYNLLIQNSQFRYNSRGNYICFLR